MGFRSTRPARDPVVSRASAKRLSAGGHYVNEVLLLCYLSALSS
jgi:hypothetical protein